MLQTPQDILKNNSWPKECVTALEKVKYLYTYYSDVKTKAKFLKNCLAAAESVRQKGVAENLITPVEVWAKAEQYKIAREF